MKKRLLCMILTLTMIFCLVPSAAAAANDEAIQAAEALYELGLFKGTGTNPDGTPIFDLDKTPTRNQAIIMLVRLLGKEEEAKAGTWKIPFTDVSDSMKPYIGYAYTNGLTNGYTATTYNGGTPAKANQYITFVLRALGYESGKDFEVATAWELSDKLGITSGQYQNGGTFTRNDVACISVSALPVAQNGSTETLAQKLMVDGVFTQEQYDLAAGGGRPSETPQEELFTLTAFGDRWIHEYLMSLDPTSVALGPERPEQVRHFDQYYFTEQYIADEIVDAIQQHYSFIRVVEAKESGTYLGGPIGNPGTRVETLEHPVYGRFIGVATFEPEGYFYETDYYLRWRIDRP